MREWLAALLELRPEEWTAPGRIGASAWLGFYAFVIWRAATSAENFIFLDFANLAIHEAGHPLFHIFGYTTGILGGTLLELLVPLGCGLAFWWKRQAAGTAFCSFWFFENFLYIGTYMADARRVTLPLVGDGTHDWEYLFTTWGVLHLDQAIGGWTRAAGWCGMVATMLWLAWMVEVRRSRNQEVGKARGKEVVM